MSHLFFYISVLLIFTAGPVLSQKKWDGGAGDGLWSNPLNWADDLAPTEEDAVLLDNSGVHASYTVQLPSGAAATTVKSIAILPSGSSNIELILPSSSTAVPALIITGPGYGLDIGRGGIFRNASGASSGTPANISDSIRIRDGGRYIHNTQRAHAANVQVLSSAPGTAEGVMEFDVPDVSSTISLSGRTFGKLVLKATAVPGGTLKYTAAGTSGVHVRGDLEITEGVSCGLNFSDTVTVDGGFFHSGTLDLGNTARRVVLQVRKDVTVTTGGIITESGSGIQQLLFSGNLPQKINMQGSISNDVEVKIDATAVSLIAPLTLHHRLLLTKGIVTTSAAALLTLGPACTIEGDTLSNAGFIDGPLRKLGMNGSDFVFPVGKHAFMRWLALKNASGDFTVEYIDRDPYEIGGSVGDGLDHISHLEHWNISGIGAIGSVKLSFADPRTGGVTKLADLRVSRLTAGTWENLGNAGTAGSAGGNGWVSSLSAGGFSAGNNYFALASSAGQENPLPLSAIRLQATKINNVLRFDWSIAADHELETFELQQETDRGEFVTVWKERSHVNVFNYSHGVPTAGIRRGTFRIRATSQKGDPYFSNLVPVRVYEDEIFSVSGESIAKATLSAIITSSANVVLDMAIYNSSGMMIRRFNVPVSIGRSKWEIDVSRLPAGIYIMRGTHLSGKTNAFRFIRIG